MGMSPNYMQQNFPPHLLDPNAFNHNPYMGVGTPGLAQHPPPQQTHFYRPEIYSGTPAPRSPPPMQMQGSEMPDSTLTGDRNSMSYGTGTGPHSRGGSPDLISEMNAMNRSPGTINQGGGAAPMPSMQEPVPQRGGLGMDIKRIDLQG